MLLSSLTIAFQKKRSFIENYYYVITLLRKSIDLPVNLTHDSLVSYKKKCSEEQTSLCRLFFNLSDIKLIKQIVSNNNSWINRYMLYMVCHNNFTGYLVILSQSSELIDIINQTWTLPCISRYLLFVYFWQLLLYAPLTTSLSTGCSLNIVFFSRILESLPPLPRQHSAAIGCTKISSQ